MAATVTGNERPVTMDCARCGKPFTQAFGFVTVQHCTRCITELAVAFWRLWDTTQVRPASSRQARHHTAYTQGNRKGNKR